MAKQALPAEVQRAVDLAIDRKGVDITLLDLRGVSNATDYFLLVNGTSDTHVRSIADHIIDEEEMVGLELARKAVAVASVHQLTQH